MTEPIPAAASLVRDFANTLDLEEHTDALDSPAAAAAWFAGHGLLDSGTPVGAAEATRARALRDRLRAVLAGAAPTGADPWTDVPLRLSLASGEPELQPAAAGVAGALGRIAAAVVAAQRDGSWHRLKLCAEHTCGWVFYDRSKNRSGRWCSMQVCGNRTKLRAYRRRQAAGN